MQPRSESDSQHRPQPAALSATLDAPRSAAPPAPLLRLRGITKRFPNVLANDAIDLDVYGGEVHAILGENGAGKSTLMKVLYGFYIPDSGTIAWNGEQVRLRSPKDGRRLGIGMVFQQFALVPAMTVAENVALFLPEQGIILEQRPLRRSIRAAGKRYGMEVDPDARVGDLTLGERQRVELLKLILGEAKVLICDEPTSVLAPHEVDGLFQVFQELKRDGYAVLFITHKMAEVSRAADRITVLRKGAVVGTMLGGQTSERELVGLMMGVAAPETARPMPQHHDAKAGAALELRDVWTVDPREPRGLRGLALHVMPGEILGIAGVSGNGQEELGEVVLGLRKRKSGAVFLLGEELGHKDVSDILQAGVSYLPEDILGMGAVPSMSVEENLVLGEVHRYGRGLGLDWPAMRRDLDAHISNIPFSMPRRDLRIDQLSGGNAQRVIVAREINRQPKVLIAFYPTRGLDVVTAEATRRMLLACREKGAAILLVSEDLNELLSLSDRLAVVYQGRTVAQLDPRETDAHHIGLLMTGHLG